MRLEVLLLALEVALRLDLRGTVGFPLREERLEAGLLGARGGVELSLVDLEEEVPLLDDVP